MGLRLCMDWCKAVGRCARTGEAQSGGQGHCQAWVAHTPITPAHVFPGEGLLSSGYGEGVSQEGILTRFGARPESFLHLPVLNAFTWEASRYQGACPEPHDLKPQQVND